MQPKRYLNFVGFTNPDLDPDQPDPDRQHSLESLRSAIQNHTSTGSRKIRKRNKQSKAKNNKYPEVNSQTSDSPIRIE